MPQIRAISTPANYAFDEAEVELVAQSAQVDQLRRQITAAQATGGRLDPVLLAEFARAQQGFLRSKIEHERLRQVCRMEEEARAEAAEEARALELLAEQTSPAVKRGKPLLGQSRGFWITIVVLLSCAWISDLLYGRLR
jgi:hypothetical protein